MTPPRCSPVPRKPLLIVYDKNDVHLLICTSFDHCFGRCTYVTAWFPRFVQEHASEIPTCTLDILDQRLTDAARHYHLGKAMFGTQNRSLYGYECDRESWLAFHEWIKTELAKRGKNGTN